MDYRLAESAAERHAALALIAADGIGGGSLPGCADENMAAIMVETVTAMHDQLAYVTAVDVDGTLVAAMAVRVHPDDTHHIAVMAYGTLKARFTRTVYRNMNVALTRVLNWPGCCGNRWVVVQPPHPWQGDLGYVSSSVTTTDGPLPGLVRISGVFDGRREYVDGD